MREIINDVFGGFFMESAGGRSSNRVFHVAENLGFSAPLLYYGIFTHPLYTIVRPYIFIVFLQEKNNERSNRLKKS